MRKRLASILSFILIMAIILAGCNAAGNSGTSDNGSGNASDDSDASGNGGAAASDQITAVTASSKIVVDKEFTANDLEVGYEDSTAAHITLDGSSIEVSGSGAKADGENLTIEEEGTYVISGSLDDGQIIVDAGENDKVKLVLNGVSVACSDSAPIYVKNADKVFITLAEGTDNILTDGSSYTQTDDNTVDGVIFSKADLTFNGKGTLSITASYKHGIVSKDELVFTGGTYNINAVKDAINGKDSVKIKDGTFYLSSSSGNGIQSKNGEDTTKGYVYISGGTITITDCREGIEGTAIVIDGGTIDITAQDDGFNAAAGTATVSSADAASSAEDTVSPWAGAISPADDTVSPSAGAASPTEDTVSPSTDTAPPSTDTMTPSTDTAPPSADTVPPSTDAASPSADAAFPPADTAASAALDDDRGQRRMGPGGFGGDGNFGGNGGGAFENDTNCYIAVNGGTITVNASGDGFDSNGSLYISGGNIRVSGPTQSMNGGMDYSGTADITGGTVIIAGSAGMAQGFSDTSVQYSILYNLTNSCTAGTEITLTDQKGNIMISYTPDKLYQSVVISTPELTGGETYTLTCGDQTAEITLDSVVAGNGQEGTAFPGTGGRGQPVN
jgi:hypothetical protein